jgi:hypothetical protein
MEVDTHVHADIEQVNFSPFPLGEDAEFKEDQPEDQNQVLIGSSFSEPLPTKRGWLQKKSSHFIRVWLWRYFVLEDKLLKYYQRPESPKPNGQINLDMVSLDLSIKNNTLVIKPLGCKRKFKLKAEDPDEIRSWAIALNLHMAASEGIKTIHTMISKKKKFWKFDRISEAQFISQATTGDLLLFRAKSVASKLQRMVTKADYDHVALILKYASGRIGLLEATGLDGVNIVMWDTFMRYEWHKLYSRLIYRKLDVERTPNFLIDLEEFIKEVKGKRYRISAGKIMGRKADRPPATEKGFFCSELVAAAYKRVGLLPQDIPSSKYWPGDFAEIKVLPLFKGARLHYEQLIDFDIDWKQ